VRRAVEVFPTVIIELNRVRKDAFRFVRPPKYEPALVSRPADGSFISRSQ